MKPFLIFARRMIRDRAMLVAAMICAILSAIGLGAGVLSMIPIIKLIVDEEELGGSLPVLAQRFNEGGRTVAGIPVAIPQWLIDLAPADRFLGVVFCISFIATLTVIGAAFNFLHQYLSITVATRTVAHARVGVFRTAMFMPLTTVTSQGASQFVARIIRDSAALQKGLIALMGKAVTHSTQAFILLAVAILAGRGLTLAAIIILPVFAILFRKIGKRIRRATRGALHSQEHLLRIATECVQGLRAVKANTGEDRAIDRFQEVNREVVRQELRARIARAVASPTVEAIAVIAVGVLVIAAAREIIAGPLTIDRFLIAISSLALAGSKVKIMAGLVNELQAASAPAERLLQVLDEPYEEPPGVARPDLPRHQRSIRLSDVSFTYPGAEDPALAHVDLQIPHGARIAVVGPNGCGKTTLLSLVPRLLVPDRGTIAIDGLDLSTVGLRSVRRQIAVVTQDIVLFRGSIAENIAFGHETATREQIVDAARRAHADEFISQIPDGYDADVAEQGHSLSGGQRQRIAIARAMLRDPSILILDEATSQIDAESEAHISAAITEFCQGRTILLIAHRLATVLDADRIVVMNHGRIVDQGRHDELLDRCALYRRLSETQLIRASPTAPTPASGSEDGDAAVQVSVAKDAPLRLPAGGPGT